MRHSLGVVTVLAASITAGTAVAEDFFGFAWDTRVDQRADCEPGRHPLKYRCDFSRPDLGLDGADVLFDPASGVCSVTLETAPTDDEAVARERFISLVAYADKFGGVKRMTEEAQKALDGVPSNWLDHVLIYGPVGSGGTWLIGDGGPADKLWMLTVGPKTARPGPGTVIRISGSFRNKTACLPPPQPPVNYTIKELTPKVPSYVIPNER